MSSIIPTAGVALALLCLGIAKVVSDFIPGLIGIIIGFIITLLVQVKVLRIFYKMSNIGNPQMKEISLIWFCSAALCGMTVINIGSADIFGITLIHSKLNASGTVLAFIQIEMAVALLAEFKTRRFAKKAT